MQIRPFAALRPTETMAARVAVPPYDVVTTEQAALMAAGNVFSFFHVTRAEIDLPAGTDLHADAVYAKAAENFARLRRDMALVRDDRPRFYVYRQRTAAHSQSGVVACCLAEEYRNGVILPHEKTRADKETDRTRHIAALGAQAGPAFLVYRDSDAVDGQVARAEAGRPLFDFTASDGVQHTVWRMDDAGAVAAAFEAVPAAYIADGHHRFAAAVRVAAERQRANPRHTGREDYNGVLAVLFPARRVKILAYNRLVRDLHGRTASAFLAVVRSRFQVRAAREAVPSSPGRVHMYVDHQWHDVALGAAPGASSPVRTLDAALLQDQILSPVLGIDDPRSSPRIGFVGGVRSTDELVRAVDSGEWAAAFSLHPVSIDDVMAYSDAGQVLPPKSTWFEPKLRSGLLIHTID